MSVRIHLDLDGCIADQVGASLKRLNLPSDFVWPAGVWDYTKATGLPAAEVWSTMSDHEFWANEIQKTPHADELVALAIRLVGVENVRIATKPILSPFSASGKVAWIQKHYPQLARQFAIIIEKADLCRPGDVLVDDSEINNFHWQAAGGIGILFPCRQNRRHAEPPTTAIEELRRVFDRG